MMNATPMGMAILALLLLPGCVAKTALDVATLPVRAGSQAVDWSTTSQEEADRNYGRKMRKQEAREAREREEAEEQRRRECRRAGYGNCQ
ncbi:hypothetical protein SAMN02927924_00213 [Sphingobium faniae]|nr:hypothetical protein SAMN02927924_00213 [Sphingobium faniae]